MGCDYMPDLDESTRRQARNDRVDSLRSRGYRPGSDGTADGLRLHKPCGALIGDPDTHDKYCPATD